MALGWRDVIVYTAIVMVLVDTVVTFLFWEMEANPLVVALGPVLWTAVKLGVSGMILYVWHVADPDPGATWPMWMQRLLYDYIFGWIAIILVLYTSVITLNVMVLV